jgi:hypothetical protein
MTTYLDAGACGASWHQMNKEIAEVPPNHAEEWTINKLRAHKLLNSKGTLHKPTDIRGVGEFPVWDFMKVAHSLPGTSWKTWVGKQCTRCIFMMYWTAI